MFALVVDDVLGEVVDAVGAVNLVLVEDLTDRDLFGYICEGELEIGLKAEDVSRQIDKLIADALLTIGPEERPSNDHKESEQFMCKDHDNYNRFLMRNHGNLKKSASSSCG